MCRHNHLFNNLLDSQHDVEEKGGNGERMRELLGVGSTLCFDLNAEYTNG